MVQIARHPTIKKIKQRIATKASLKVLGSGTFSNTIQATNAVLVGVNGTNQISISSEYNANTTTTNAVFLIDNLKQANYVLNSETYDTPNAGYLYIGDTKHYNTWLNLTYANLGSFKNDTININNIDNSKYNIGLQHISLGFIDKGKNSMSPMPYIEIGGHCVDGGSMAIGFGAMAINDMSTVIGGMCQEANFRSTVIGGGIASYANYDSLLISASTVESSVSSSSILITTTGENSIAQNNGIAIGISHSNHSIISKSDSIAIGHANVAAGAENNIIGLLSAENSSIAMGTSIIADNKSIAIGGNVFSISNSISIGREVFSMAGSNSIALGHNIGINVIGQYVYNDGIFIGSNIDTSRMINDKSVKEGPIYIGSNIMGTNPGTIAIGHQTTTKGLYATALGYNVNINGNHSIALGVRANINGIASIALGASASASAPYTVVIGAEASANNVEATAIGSHTRANGWGAVAFGPSANAFGTYSTALGSRSFAEGDNSIAIGINTNAIMSNAIAIGTLAKANANNTIAIGSNSCSAGNNSISIGTNTNSGNFNSAIAIGNNAVINFDEGISIGNHTTSGIGGIAIGAGTSSSAYGTAIGYYSFAQGISSVSIGGPFVSGEKAIGIGYFANTSGSHSIAMGSYKDAHGDNSIAIGTYATVNANDAIAIGTYANVPTPESIAIGCNAIAIGLEGIAIGSGADASGTSSVAIGYVTNANGWGAVAIGSGAIAENYATALGYLANANGSDTIALGYSVIVNGENSIAIGANMRINGSNTICIGKNPTTTAYNSSNNSIIISLNEPSTKRDIQIDQSYFLLRNSVDIGSNLKTSFMNINNSLISIGKTLFQGPQNGNFTIAMPDVSINVQSRLIAGFYNSVVYSDTLVFKTIGNGSLDNINISHGTIIGVGIAFHLKGLCDINAGHVRTALRPVIVGQSISILDSGLSNPNTLPAISMSSDRMNPLIFGRSIQYHSSTDKESTYSLLMGHNITSAENKCFIDSTIIGSNITLNVNSNLSSADPDVTDTVCVVANGARFYENTSNSVIIGSRHYVNSNYSAPISAAGDCQIVIGSGASAERYFGEGSSVHPDGSNSIAIGTLAHVYSSNYSIAIGTSAVVRQASNSVALGSFAEESMSNSIRLGQSGTTVRLGSGATVTSDARDKADVKELNLGLNFIKLLKPKSFKYNYREDYIQFADELDDDGNIIKPRSVPYKKDKDGNDTGVIDLNAVKNDGSKTGTRSHAGFIAQDIKELLDKNNMDYAMFCDLSKNGGPDQYAIRYDELIAPAIKAIIELSDIVEKQTKTIEKLESSVKTLESKILKS